MAELPEGITWYWGQDSLFRHATGGMLAAWDKGPDGSKAYCAFDTGAECLAFVQSLPHEQRCGYELIREGRACKPYADVEWELAVADSGEFGRLHAAALDEMQALTAELSAHVTATLSLPAQARVLMLDGSRVKSATKVKLSFHLIVTNVFMANNCDGAMKGLFARLGSDRLDMAVYTPNRVFRLPLCAKWGDATPLRPIDGGEEDLRRALLTERFGDEMDAPACPSLLANGLSKKRPAGAAAAAAPKRQAAADDGKLSELQRFLRIAGDSTTLVTKCKESEGEELRYVCRTQPGGRVCLNDVSRGTTHDSNNCYLTLYPTSDRQYDICYRCLTPNCPIVPRQQYKVGTLSVCEREAYSSARAGQWVARVCVPSPMQPVMQQQPPPVHEVDIEEVRRLMKGVMNRHPTVLTALKTLANHRPQDAAEYARLYSSYCASVTEPEGGGWATAQLQPSTAEAMDSLRKRFAADESYEAVKAGFERNHFFVRHPPCYIFMGKSHGLNLSYDELLKQQKDDKDWRPEILPLKQLRDAYLNLNYVERDARTAEAVKKNFVARWVHDDTIPTYDRVEVNPDRDDVKEGVFNIWTGLLAERLPPISAERAEELAAPFFRHVLEVLADNNLEIYEYLRLILASIVQRPHKKTEIAVVLFGAHGAGKDILLDFLIKKVFGTGCSAQTADPEHDIFGQFGNKARDKIFIRVAEAEGMYKFLSKLKDMITSPTLRYEIKGGANMEFANYSNLFFTTNRDDAFKIEIGERRMLMLTVSSAHKGDTAYFQQLGDSLQHAQTPRAIYQVLSAIDIGNVGYSLQHLRPETEMHKELELECIPLIGIFLSALSNSRLAGVDDDAQTFRVQPAELYEAACAAKIYGRRIYNDNIVRFGRHVTKIVGNDSRCRVGTTGGANYCLSKASLRQKLTHARLYVPDVVLPDYVRINVI